jgi:hypothetical protein
LAEKPYSSSHSRLSQAVSSDNGPNGVSQRPREGPPLPHWSREEHKPPSRQSVNRCGRAPLESRLVAPPVTTQPPASAHLRRLPPPLPVPTMARAALLIDSVSAGAGGNQDHFRCSLRGLVSQSHSEHQHVATLPGGDQEKPPESHAATGACDNLSRVVALIPWRLRTPTPPQPRVPTLQRRRAAARQRGAADSARITGNTPFLASPRPARPHPGHRWPCSRSDRPLLLL